MAVHFVLSVPTDAPDPPPRFAWPTAAGCLSSVGKADAPPTPRAAGRTLGLQQPPGWKSRATPPLRVAVPSLWMLPYRSIPHPHPENGRPRQARAPPRSGPRHTRVERAGQRGGMGLAQWDHPVGLSCTRLLPRIAPTASHETNLQRIPPQQPPIPSSAWHRYPHATHGGRRVGNARDLGPLLEPAQGLRVGYARLLENATSSPTKALRGRTRCTSGTGYRGKI